jgi:hypothetical protein
MIRSVALMIRPRPALWDRSPIFTAITGDCERFVDEAFVVRSEAWRGPVRRR